MGTKVKPFDSFSAVYKIIIRIGFYKLLNEKNSCIKICHSLYRIIVFIVVLFYNLTYIMFIIQPSNDSGLRLEALMIEIPQINLFWKLLVLALYSSRVDKINKLLNDPIFAANGEEDEKYLSKNVREAHRLSNMLNMFVSVAAVCWPTSTIFQTLQDESYVLPVYIPFKTDTFWAKFVVICLIQLILLPWVGYGHVTLDCLVVTYYAQAQVQLKIIKHHLKHLFDTKGARNEDNIYKDVIDKEKYDNFVYYIKRYEKLVWYTYEVNRIFNPSMTFQFLTSSATMCIVIYQMSETDVLSLKFLFLIVLIIILLIQVFLYCYYGNLVRHESESMNTSLYVSKWTSASPRFRRMMLVAMARWSKPLTTKVAGIIPLALDTFIAIIRFSYTLYTVLSTKHEIRK